MRHPRPQVEGKLARCCASLVAVLAIGTGTATATQPATRGDRDCADFSNQAEAQAFFESHGPGDPDQLDGDGDGKACEDLPCPCSSGGPPSGGHGGTGNPRGATVSGIADGDTIEVHRRGRTEDVRLIGIDTPEVYLGEECGGAQASASIKRMLEIGDRVHLVRDRSQDNRDRYGRLLRYVEHRGRDVGRRQIRKGWAAVYVFETAFDRLPTYRSAESAAESRRRGVWGRCGGNFHQPL